MSVASTPPRCRGRDRQLELPRLIRMRPREIGNATGLGKTIIYGIEAKLGSTIFVTIESHPACPASDFSVLRNALNPHCPIRQCGLGVPYLRLLSVYISQLLAI